MVYELPHELPNDLRLRILPSLFPRRQTPAIEVKKPAKVDIKLCLSYPALLDPPTLVQIPSAGPHATIIIDGVSQPTHELSHD